VSSALSEIRSAMLESEGSSMELERVVSSERRQMDGLSSEIGELQR
jgi:uncharacterized protein YfiM (DUF2279 family)